MVNHYKYLKPIVPPKYDVGFVVDNCTNDMLKELEPWCCDMYGDFDAKKYIEFEQADTQFNLSNIIHKRETKPINDVVVSFDCNKLTPDNFQILVELSSILQESGEVGEMELQIFKFYIKSLDTYEKDLILVK